VRKLKIDLGELAFAFENASREMVTYLDRQTGEIILVTDETRRLLEDALEEVGDREMGAKELADLVLAGGAHDWQAEAALDAARIELEPSRFLVVRHGDSREGFRDMEAFVGTVADERLRDALDFALGGRHPFRAFKDVLLGFPQERERWFAFHDARLRQRVLEWLEVEGIEVMEGG
jgi:hypothetical protein